MTIAAYSPRDPIAREAGFVQPVPFGTAALSGVSSFATVLRPYLLAVSAVGLIAFDRPCAAWSRRKTTRADVSSRPEGE